MKHIPFLHYQHFLDHISSTLNCILIKILCLCWKITYSLVSCLFESLFIPVLLSSHIESDILDIYLCRSPGNIRDGLLSSMFHEKMERYEMNVREREKERLWIESGMRLAEIGGVERFLRHNRKWKNRAQDEKRMKSKREGGRCSHDPPYFLLTFTNRKKSKKAKEKLN